MKQYLENFKSWYECREIREKLLVVALGWAFLYAIFSLLFFRQLDQKKSTILNEMTELNNQITSLKTQIDAVNKISSTPLYKEWLKHRQALLNLQGQYKFFIKNNPTQQWQDIIKTILQSQNNVTLVEVKNSPETNYNPSALTDVTAKIYQQQLHVAVYSNFVDTVNYLQGLEKALPNIHWDSLNYEVVKYPIAKITTEFSIIYEKN